MGKSAKFMKRPTKAEKVSRQVNKPAAPRERSLSPEAPRSAIPLFNTSVPGRQTSKPDPRLDQLAASSSAPLPAADTLDEDAMDDDVDGEEAPKAKKKRSLKDKVKAAKESLKDDEQRSKGKLGGKPKKGGKPHVLGGADYLKMHESRPGGAFKHKKFR
ncbi:hypothetical protein JCM21900_003484 [Sporobolomyces salmonicolor]